MGKIGILLIDDHDVIRTGVRRMLELEDDFEVLGESSGAENAFSLVERINPAIILMDIKMPGMDGIELTRQIKARFPDCRIVIFTLHGDYLSQAFKAGASGYLLKDIRRDDLSEAIRKVVAGEKVIGKNIGTEIR